MNKDTSSIWRMLDHETGLGDKLPSINFKFFKQEKN